MIMNTYFKLNNYIIYRDVIKWISSTLLIILFIIPLGARAQISGEVAIANSYYQSGEYQKAIDLYEKLAKKPGNIPFIHKNFLDALISSAKFPQAEKYLQRNIKQFPYSYQYSADYLHVLLLQNEQEKADRFFQSLSQDIIRNDNALRVTAHQLMSYQHLDYAEKLYLEGRAKNKDPHAFAYDLGTLYRLQHDPVKMVQEYIYYIMDHPKSEQYIKNVLQVSLQGDEDYQAIVPFLLQRIQENPKQTIYNELLYWAYLQQKNFYGAFIQARALDRRLQQPGTNTLEAGKIALHHKAYQVAKQAFEYVIKQYPKGPHYVEARRLVIYSKQQLLTKQFPIDTAAVKDLVADYDALFNEVGTQENTLQASRDQAQLYALYLDQKEKAISILQNILKQPAASNMLKGQVKLDLGDIYLLTGEPWESTLLYGQVEKSLENTPLEDEAKLKLAKLAFYKGEFSLAKDYLNILKLNTRREIANDALELSLIIQNNMAYDTAGRALTTYAHADLLIYQHRYQAAEDTLQKIGKLFPNQHIHQMALWSQGDIAYQNGRWQQALTFLEELVKTFPNGVRADDAVFRMARIYEEALDDKEKAKEFYQDLLLHYAGSMHVQEARQHFRRLRGDFVN